MKPFPLSPVADEPHIHLSRFVTGLLDLEQDAKYKVSMYTTAQHIGLPALFVDLRHETAHGEMPRLDALRAATQQALRWLWDDYWAGVGGSKVDDEDQHDALQLQGGHETHMALNVPARGQGLVGGEEQPEQEEQLGEWMPWQGSWKSEAIGVGPRRGGEGGGGG